MSDASSMSVAAGIPGDPRSAGLYGLRWKPVWAFIKRQRASFLLICLYSFFEYVRPQAIYPIIYGMPLASITLLLCVAACFKDAVKPRRGTLIDPLLFLFSCIVVVSVITAWKPSLSLEILGPSYFGWVLIFVLISTIVNSEDKFFFFALCYLLWSFKMSQHGVRAFASRGFSFAGWGMTCAPQYFQNSGECGIQMAMFFPFALYFYLGLRTFWDKKRKWLMAFVPASAAITIISSSSRGAQLALAAVMLWIVLRSRKRARALVLMAVAAAGLYAILPAEQIQRFRDMGTDETSLTRRQYWRDGMKIMREHPVSGIGFNNWKGYYRAYYNPEGEKPHNIFIEAGSELGYPGLAAFILLIIGTFVLNYRTRAIARRIDDGGGGGKFLWNMAHGLDGALVGYIVSAFFVTVMYYPFFWINLSMTVALHTATRNKAAMIARATAAGNAAAAQAYMAPVPPPQTLGGHA